MKFVKVTWASGAYNKEKNILAVQEKSGLQET
jgi:hypothetical protein